MDDDGNWKAKTLRESRHGQILADPLPMVPYGTPSRAPQTSTIDPGKAKESDGDITEDPRFGSQRPLGKEKFCWKGPSDMSHVSRRIPPVNIL